MKKLLLTLLALAFVLPVPCAASDLELDLACLKEAYPGLVQGVEHAPDKTIWLITSDGTRLLYDDGRIKSAEEELADADIEDSMKYVYPLEPDRQIPNGKNDPGRVRSLQLLHVLYGKDKKDVEQYLVKRPLAGMTLRCHERLGNPLAALQEKVRPLLATRPDLRPYFTNMGCYFWRTIAGTNRLSPHSFGLALDLNPKISPYWRWCTLRPHPEQQTYPPELVALLEEHGFIWGGKWSHYDLMHFEYRPELVLKAQKLRHQQ